MDNISKKPIAFILGPTASGKTDLAIEICDSVPAEIISVDSVMVYKDCNIGSAKPSKDILEKYQHHLVDCIEPSSIFSVSDFYCSSLELIDEIHSRDKLPVFVGGTMMYFKTLINGLDTTNFRNFTGSSTVPFEFYDVVEVKTGGYSAEFGKAIGGVVNAVTKSGSNEWKFGGNAYFFPKDMYDNKRDTYISANRFDERDYKTYNVYASGPIVKDKAFFYVLAQPTENVSSISK